MLKRVRSGIAQKRGGKEPQIYRIGGNDFQKSVVALVQSKFHRVIVEHRGHRLILQLLDRWVGCEDREMGDVGQGHHAPWMGCPLTPMATGFLSVKPNCWM